MIKIKQRYPLIILSLVLLFNPNINIIDVMPDFVAYMILALMIGGLASGVPYLAECKEALVKLTLITLIKIPAFVIMYSNMGSGSDIIPLFTLSFAVLECIFIYGALRNFFLAVSYLGERTDCQAARMPFHVSKKKSISLETFERITLAVFFIKAMLSVLPELFLLTGEDFVLKRKLMDIYPTALILSLAISLVIMTVWLICAIKCVKNIRNIGDLGDALRQVESYSSYGISDTEKLKKRLIEALNLLALSSIFIFDISFQNTNGHNILPHFIYGIVLFCAVINLTDKKLTKILLIAFTLGFSISALINQSLCARFFDRYQYIDLSYSRIARAEYRPIKITAVTETVFVIAMTVVAAVILVSFIKSHTDTNPSDPAYSISNRRAHKRLIKITLPLMVLSAVINVMKCLNVFLKQNVTIIPTQVNPDGIAAPGIPAFTTAIVLFSIAYVIYSMVAVSTLKDEVRLKYGKEN